MHPIWEKIISDYNFCNYDVDVQRVYKTYKLGSKQHSIAVILRELKDRLNLTNLLHYQKLQTYIMSLKMSCLDCPYLKIDFPKTLLFVPIKRYKLTLLWFARLIYALIVKYSNL